MNILHITDLHLNHFEGDEEFLRKGFYREYIDKLFLSLKNKLNSVTIDCLIVTGDFIDKGKVENYESVELILNYLINKFSISKENICFSIGNHDYKWKELDVENVDIEKEIQLRIPFKNFCDKYNKNYLKEAHNFFLKKLEDAVYYLSIDSSWMSRKGEPGSFKTKEVDELINLMRDTINCNATLLIGCHFPVTSFEDSFLAGEELNWHTKHLWINGRTIRERINNLDTKNIIWFHGDVHASDQKIINDDIFILTSKFGGKPDTSEQKRQAVLISLEEESISRITCSYEFPTHNQNQSLGDWRCSDKHELRSFKVVKGEQEKFVSEFSAYDDEVEDEILRIVRENELYKFGRFNVGDKYISLGWVEINKLMNDKKLLYRISDKCYKVIRTKINDKKDKTLFLGIEIIGGILASQLSVRFDIRNSIIPVRTKPDHYSEFEFSHSSAFEQIDNIENIIIFIDLISTGSTINSLVEEIISIKSEINIHVISIISNDIENRIKFIPKTKSYTAFCTKIKIPMIKNEEMPDESYVKPNLRY